jgi:DNA replication protein DnaC
MKHISDNQEAIQKILYRIKNLNGITKSVYSLEDDAEYVLHSKIITHIGQALLAKEFRNFEVDDYNAKILRFLLLYFNNCQLAETIFPNEHYKVHKQIMIIGKIGVGKTMLMQIFSEYLRITDNPNQFVNISITEMINYFKIHNHLDKFIYNELSEHKGRKTNAINFCLNDLGLSTYNHFGVDTKMIIDDFLYARYELFIAQDKKAHVTSNLSVGELKKMYDARIIDRFKSYNILQFDGISRRK